MPSQGPDAASIEGTREDTGSEATVEAVGFEVAHDSDGLLVVTLRFPNGAKSQLHLSGAALGRVLESLRLTSAHQLVGRRFSEIAPGLPTNASAVSEPPAQSETARSDERADQK